MNATTPEKKDDKELDEIIKEARLLGESTNANPKRWHRYGRLYSDKECATLRALTFPDALASMWDGDNSESSTEIKRFKEKIELSNYGDFFIGKGLQYVGKGLQNKEDALYGAWEILGKPDLRLIVMLGVHTEEKAMWLVEGELLVFFLKKGISVNFSGNTPIEEFKNLFQQLKQEGKI